MNLDKKTKFKISKIFTHQLANISEFKKFEFVAKTEFLNSVEDKGK